MGVERESFRNTRASILVIEELLDSSLASDVSYLQFTPDGIRSSKFCRLTPDLAIWKTPTLTIGTPHEGAIARNYSST